MVFISQFLTLNSQNQLQMILPLIFSIFSYCLLPHLPCSPNSYWLILRISKETVSNVKHVSKLLSFLEILIFMLTLWLSISYIGKYQFSSAQLLSCVWLCNPMNCSMSCFPVHHQLLEFHPTISSSSVPFSSCLQSFPASGSFQMSQLFVPGGQSIGVSASASVLPMNIQDWFPLGWTGWISLQSKGLSRVFSNTTVGKYDQM